MSYICHATDRLVIGEKCQMVPTEIRKVTYVAQVKPDRRSDYLRFDGQTEGWEIVKEVPIRNSLAADFTSSHVPKVVGEKEVRYMKPKSTSEDAPRSPNRNAPPRRGQGLVKLALS